MPLNLVTGPANAGKARHVLDAVRGRVEDDPLLVVPTVHDAEAYRRELAEGGTVFGPRVMVFDGLIAEMAHRAGSAEEALGPAQRDRLLAAAVAAAELEALAASAGSPGFVGAVGALVAELQRELVTPQRFAQAMTAWGVAHGRETYAGEVAALYRGYRERLDGLCRVDGELRAWRAPGAPRGGPPKRGGPPRFPYRVRHPPPPPRGGPGGAARERGRPPVFPLRLRRPDPPAARGRGDAGRLRGRRCDGRADLGGPRGPRRAVVHVPGARTPRRPPRGPARSLRVLRE